MTRALAVAGVMGAGTVLVFWAAYLASVLVPTDRLVWQRPTADVDLRRGPVVVRPAPIDPKVQPWIVPVLPGPDVVTDPPVLIDPAIPDPTDRSIDG
jgi:hypothetical protein